MIEYETDYFLELSPDILPIYTVEKRMSLDVVNAAKPLVRLTAPSDTMRIKITVLNLLHTQGWFSNDCQKPHTISK